MDVRAPLDFEGSDFLARKKYAMLQRVEAEIRMQTQKFAIYQSNETAIIGIPPLIKSLLSMSQFL